MDSYLDTSFVMKFYVTEAESIDCIQWLQQNRHGAYISSLTDVEMSASLTRAFKDDPKVGALVLNDYRRDCASGVFRRITITDKVYRKAEQLAELHTNTLNLKSLDLLHLTTALHYSLPSVGSFDKNMRAAALALGLQVLPA